MDAYNPYNYPTKQPDRIARFAYKCLHCKHQWAREYVAHQEGWDYHSQPAGAYYYSPAWRFAALKIHQNHLCPACGSNRTKHDEIHGKKNNAIPCSEKCTGAHGHDCECSCGGENHCKNHVISDRLFS